MSHSRRRRAQQTYRITLLIFAALATLLALLIVAIVEQGVEQGAVGDAIRAALRDLSALNDDETRVAAELTLIPLAVGALTYLLAAQGIRLLRLSIYLRNLHRVAGERLQRRAPLYRLSHRDAGSDLPLITPVDARGRPLDKPETLTRILADTPHALLLGPVAAGKTTALLGLAYEASRRRELLPLFLGRRALPILVSLPQYAEASGSDYDGPNVDYLADQVAAYSSPGFAARLPSYLRRKRVLLLGDDLDEALDGELGQVIGHLSHFGARPYRRTYVIATANSATRESLTRQIGDKKQWRTYELAAQEPEASTVYSTYARRPGARGAAATSILRAHLLDDARRLPVALTALEQISGQTPPPYGIVRLLADQCRIQCESVASQEIPVAFLVQFLGGLASALRASGEHAIALEPDRELGPSVSGWLDIYRPLSPTVRRQSGGIGLNGQQIEELCAAAVAAGLLLIAPDGTTLRFTHRLIEATCAAQWLLDKDDADAPLDPRLLGEQWTIPLVFWAGLSDRPERVADGLLHLRGTSRSTASRAGLKRYATVQPAALVLALATIVYGGAVQLAMSSEAPSGATRAASHIEAKLRAILDEALTAVADPLQTSAIAEAARSVRLSCAPEIDTALRTLVHTPSFGRLTQAELYTALGLFASPTAIRLLIERLGEREPTIRAGVTRGLTLAGYAALPELQAQIINSDQGMRIRAAEIIDAIGASDEEGDTSAERTAVHILVTGAPDQRIAAAETLGALQAHPAIAPLIKRLCDREPDVRIAAARALGKFGAPEALEPLRAALHRASPEVRCAIAEALGAYQSVEVATDLARLLDDPAPAVRATAATALSAIPDEAAILALKAHRDDPDPSTRALVESALRRLGQR